MSGTDYSYDEQGQFFPFFILTITAIVTVPLTYSVLKPSSEPAATAPRIKTDFRPEHADLIESQVKAQKRRERKLKRIIAVVAGWAIIGLMAYLIVVTARTVPKIWNPYDILGISDSANEKQIKSHYKRLSLKFHPDKIRPDPAKNETLESLNDHFVEITKAYKALTDEEVRNNYIQYGHPDGKQSFSIGIALPKFMVTEGNGKYVLLAYAGLLGVLLPWLVGSWWYGLQRMSNDGVLIESANRLFREYNDNIKEGGIVSAFSTGAEYEQLLTGDKAESGLAKVESRILTEGSVTPFAAGLSEQDRRKLEGIDGGVRRKVLALLWAYLGRIELDDPALNEAKIAVAPIAHSLTKSFLNICLAYASIPPIITSYQTMQKLIQAMPPKSSPLLQLPHITPSIAKAIEGDSLSHLTLQQYMQLPEAQRRKMSIGKAMLTEPQYHTAMSAARQLPNLQVEKVFFKCTGEQFVTSSCLVHLVIKARAIPPGTLNIPPVNELDLEDIDPDETDLDAINGRKKKGPKGEILPDQTPIQPPLVFAPYFARDITPRWHLFMSDSKQGRLAVPPITVHSFDKKLFDEEGKPTFNMLTIKHNFQAPQQPGQYTFCVHLICDSYVGFDTKVECRLTVEEASKAKAMRADDEISEPDEDSLAGQMNAMKSGGITGVPPPKKKKKPLDEESSDESATEEEEVDTSETNTDTEDEG